METVLTTDYADVADNIRTLLIRPIRVIRGLSLRFDRNFGLHRIGNEALLMSGMIHLLEFLGGGLLLARELQSLV